MQSEGAWNTSNEEELSPLLNTRPPRITFMPTWGITGMRKMGYDLKEVIAGMTISVVRRAIRRSDSKEVAVKCISSQDHQLRQYMQNEFRFMCRCRHRSFVRPHAMYQSRFDSWLCIEWCSGGSLDKHVSKKGPFTEPQVQDLSRQVLSGISYLHENHVIHGDICPVHILLQNGATTIKIGGLGNARRLPKKSGGVFIVQGRSACSLSAPECRFGALMNKAMDIWGFGICVHYMLCACAPFAADDPAVIRQLLSGVQPDISQGSMSVFAKDLVTECLRPDRRLRPQAAKLNKHPMLEKAAGPPATGAGVALPRTKGYFESVTLPSCGILSVWTDGPVVDPFYSSVPSSAADNVQRFQNRIVKRGAGYAPSCWSVQTLDCLELVAPM